MKNIKGLIYQSELDFIANCVLDYPNLETGGDFFGFWTKEGNPVVQFVIGPGENTTRTETSFYQDIPYLKKCGAVLNGKYGLEHIGGWHSHHRLSLANPSGGDVNTMRNLLREGNIKNFLVAICNIEGKSDVTINGFLFSHDNPKDYTKFNWQVYDGISPFREILMKDGIDFFVKPYTRKTHPNVSTNEVKEKNNNNQTEKPEMPSESFWKTDKGKETIKHMYQTLSKRTDISNFEMVQKEDGRLAFRFTYSGVINEIVLPHEYPNKPVEVSRRLPNDIISFIDFPISKKRPLWGDFDLSLRYMEAKFKKLFHG